MTNAENHPPKTLGLVGDGDEIAAIAEVEQHFGVRLDYSDAKSWTTVGDVFVALQRALPTGRAGTQDTWTKFAAAISLETGVDPSKVNRDTSLLGQHRFDPRLALTIPVLIGLAIAIAWHW